MHRSRLYGIFIDTPLAEAGASISFWSEALGAAPTKPGTADDAFTALPGVIDGLVFELQAVDDAPRYHVDIETDDVPAETARLVALGATVVTPHERWQVLRAPGGHLLCVVPVQSEPTYFATNSRSWS